MLFDMNPDLLESAYIMSRVDSIVKRMATYHEDDLPYEFIREFGYVLIFHRTAPSQDIHVFFYSSQPEFGFMSLVRRLYRDEFTNIVITDSKVEPENLPNSLFDSIKKSDYRMYVASIDGIKNDYDDDWYENTGLEKSDITIDKRYIGIIYAGIQLRSEIKALRSIQKSIIIKNARKSKTIDEIFSLSQGR
jgi:hypothetical protein